MFSNFTYVRSLILTESGLSRYFREECSDKNINYIVNKSKMPLRAEDHKGKVKSVKYGRQEKRYRSVLNPNTDRYRWEEITRRKLTKSYPKSVVKLEK